MKVYFEESGWSHKTVTLSIYVKPQKDGSGYFYNTDGKEINYKWVCPSKSVVVDSSELPTDLWYSIKHGLHNVELPIEKQNGWIFDDLIYEKVSKKEVAAFRKASLEIKKVQTLDDFKKLYPTIKKSHRISNAFIDKLFSVCGLPLYDVNNAKNGEIGIAFFYKCCYYQALLKKLGLDD